ncbi:MAG: hypothetical protein AMXMBFR84_40270 [Candidatus Hydrogenedentota bacterium]
MTGAARMNIDYDRVSESYDVHRTGAGPYLDVLVEIAAASGSQVVLEAGAGTGSVAAAFERRHPCRMLALDRSKGMCRRNRVKHPHLPIVIADACTLPMRDASVDMIYSVFMLHHLSDLTPFFSECTRVLRRGALAVVTSPYSFLESHPMNHYFPSFARVDKARFQSEESVHAAFSAAGFQRLKGIIVKSEPCPIDKAYVNKVADKFISTYALLPAGEFERGLADLRRDVEARGCLEPLLEWEALVVWGVRP